MFFHECRKIVKNSTVWGLLFLLLFVNAATIYYVDNRELDAGMYREVWEEVESAPAGEALDVVAEGRERSVTEGRERSVIEGRERSFTEGQERSFTEEQDVVTNAVRKEIEAVQGYREYREQILRNAAAMRIFSEKGSFAQKNIVETEDHFRKLGDIDTALGPSAGIRHIFSRVTAIYVILFLCYVGYLLFIRDGETGIETMLRTSKNGGVRFCLCKMAVHVAAAGAASFICYICNVVQQHLMYGFGDLSRSIQSVPEYQSCGRILSVRGFIMCGVLLCVLSCVGMALLIGMVCAMSRHKVSMLLILFGLAAVCAADYVFVPLDSLWGWTKYLNPCFFLDAGEVLGKYVNLNIMNGLWPYAPTLFALLFTAVLLCGAGTVIGFARHLEGGRHEKGVRRERGGASKFAVFARKRWHFSLRYYERVKIRRESRLCLVAVFFLILAAGVSYKDRITFADEDEYYYYCYMKQLEGERTPEKAEFLEAENREFDRMAKKRQEMLDSGAGDEALYAVTGERMRKWNGFTRALERDRYLEQNQLDTYVYEDGFFGLFDMEQTENKMLLLGSLVFCVIVLSGVFAADEERKIGTLLRLTREGAGRQAWIKVFCSFEVAVLGLLICYLPQFAVFIRLYGVAGLNAPAPCIGVWQGIGFPCAVWVWILIRYALRLAVLVGWTVCILLISAKTKHVLLTMLFSFVPVVIAGVVMFLGM